MRRASFGLVTAVAACAGLNSAVADSPYLPFNSNGTLIVPEDSPKPSTGNTPPTYEFTPKMGGGSSIPNTTIPLQPGPTLHQPTPALTPTPAQSAPNQPTLSQPAPAQSVPNQPSPTNTYSPPKNSQPNPAFSTPSQSPSMQSTPMQMVPMQQSPTVVTPGMGVPEVQPYSTGYRGPGLWDYFWAPSWPQQRQTNYGPAPFAAPGGCGPCGSMNFDFGRGYDGFMTGW